MRRLSIGLVGCVICALGGSVVAGPKQEARAKLARAMEAHKQGRFADALVDLEAAYKLDPRPDLLFAMGQVYVKLGRCDEAANAYEHFLASSKDRDMPAVVKQALAACTPASTEPPPALAAPPTIPPSPAITSPGPGAPIASPTATASPASPRPFDRGSAAEIVVHDRTSAPWYADKLGDALVAGGVAAAAVGLVLYRGALSDLDDAEAATSIDRYNQLADRAHTERTYSVVLAGVGTAFVVGGIVHFMLHARATESPVGLAPTHGGGVVTWTGGF